MTIYKIYEEINEDNRAVKTHLDIQNIKKKLSELTTAIIRFKLKKLRKNK